MAKQNTASDTKTADSLNDDTADAVSEENSAQALIARADKLIGDLDATYRIGIEKVERKNTKPFDAAFAALYVAIVAIEDAGQTEAFLASRGIRAHGSTRNPYFNMLRAFANSASTVLQGRFCKKAQVIALARRQDVKPADFEKWKKLWPIERACEELRRLNNSPPREKKEKPEPKVITRGLAGEHPAVLEFASDGSGKFQLVRILSPDDLLTYAEARQHRTTDNAQNS